MQASLNTALQVTTSINDCLLRSRGHAKYVISSDLDEIVVTNKESSLLNLLNSLQAKFERSAAFVIRSSFALFEVSFLALAVFPKYCKVSKYKIPPRQCHSTNMLAF